MTKNKSIGFALVILGGVFIAATTRNDHMSTVGLVAGILFILAGLLRVVFPRHSGS